MTMRYSHLSESYLRTAVNGVVLGGAKQETGANAPEDGTYLAPEHAAKSA
jgi:hypothetical protein